MISVCCDIPTGTASAAAEIVCAFNCALLRSLNTPVSSSTLFRLPAALAANKFACIFLALPAKPKAFPAAVPGIKKDANDPNPCPNFVLNLSRYSSSGPTMLSLSFCCSPFKYDPA